MCRKPVAAALAGGKSGISADAGVVVVDAGAISVPLSGSAICGVGAVLSELLPQLVASSTMAASRLVQRMRFFEAGNVI